VFDYSSLVPVVDFLQSTTGIIALIAFVPQWMLIIRSKSTAGLSLPCWLMWLVSSSFALCYAFVHLKIGGNTHVLLYTTVISFVATISTVGLILWYHPKRLSAKYKSQVSTVSPEHQGNKLSSSTFRSAGKHDSLRYARFRRGARKRLVKARGGFMAARSPGRRHWSLPPRKQTA